MIMDYQPIVVMGVGLLLGSVIRVRWLSSHLALVVACRLWRRRNRTNLVSCVDTTSSMQGVTGFGSSIALLSVWVLSRAVGIRTSESFAVSSYCTPACSFYGGCGMCAEESCYH